MEKMINKYVRFDDGFWITFPNFIDDIQHKQFSDMICLNRNRKPISAGFIMLLGDKIHCSGISTSLGIGVAPDDEQFFRERLMI